MIVGPALVIAYNAELFGGIIHTDLGFAAAWGAFPVLTAYTAETGRIAVAPVLAALAALAMSAAQRRLSTPARTLRRRSVRVEGTVTLADGQVVAVDQVALLAPLEGALRAMSWGHRAARRRAGPGQARLAHRRLTRYRGGTAGGQSASLRSR